MSGLVYLRQQRIDVVHQWVPKSMRRLSRIRPDVRERRFPRPDANSIIAFCSWF